MTGYAPADVPQETAELPPGHKFGLYGPVVTKSLATEKTEKHDRDAKLFRSVAGKLPESVEQLAREVAARQQAAAERAGALRIPLEVTSPLATGLGLEHPTENGFAFSSPYGLPYLPGSSVKGVVRRAAEELALFAPNEHTGGWTLGAVWWLFGFDENAAYIEGHKGAAEAWVAPARKSVEQDELVAAYLKATIGGGGPDYATVVAEKSAIRTAGAIRCWDAHVAPTKKELIVTEVMTPHFSKHYQGERAPTDDDSPKPIRFLAIARGARLEFTFECSAGERLPPSLRTGWRELVTHAVDYAALHLGFGAKTSAGYGRLGPDEQAEKRMRFEEAERERAEEQKRQALEAERRERALEQMGPAERWVAKLEDPNCTDETAAHAFADIDTGELKDDAEGSRQVAHALKERMLANGQWKSGSKKMRARKKRIRQILGED